MESQWLRLLSPAYLDFLPTPTPPMSNPLLILSPARQNLTASRGSL